MDLQVRLQSAATEINALTGDTYTNEDLFEVYAQRLFKRSDFDMLYATTLRDYYDGKGIESAKKPYYQFWHKSSGHSFWVKYEFRSDYDKLDLCRPDQIKCYRQFQEAVWPEKVYVVIGFGRQPLKPSFMFCMPLDEAENYGIFPIVLERFERNPRQPFDYQNGRLV